MPDITTAFGKYGSSLQLARVDGYNTETFDDGSDTESANSPVPTGLLDITMLSREGTRTAVPFVLPTTGSSTFMGSLPEIGSLCIVGFFEQNSPVIIGFLPKGLSNLIGSRAVIPNLQPGEVLLQASSSDADVDGNDQQFVGAAIKLDSYGRIIITVPGYKVTYGYLLSNEGTPDVTSENDPITGSAIFMHETFPGGTQKRVCDDGSVVNQYGKDKVERVGGNVDSQINGQIVVVARAGQTYKDKRGNKFGLDADGNVVMETPTGGFSASAQGPMSFETGSSESHRTLREYKRTVGASHTTVIGANRKTIIGNLFSVAPTGDVTVVLGLGGSQELIAVGIKYIEAIGGIYLTTLPVPIPLGVPVPAAILIPPMPPGTIGLIAPIVGLGIAPTIADALVTLSTFTTFMSLLITMLATTPTSPPGAPLLPAAASLLNPATMVLAASKTVWGSP